MNPEQLPSHRPLWYYRVAGLPLISHFPVATLRAFASGLHSASVAARKEDAVSRQAIILEALAHRQKINEMPVSGATRGQKRYREQAALGPAHYDLQAGWPARATCHVLARKIPGLPADDPPAWPRNSPAETSARWQKFSITPRGIAVGWAGAMDEAEARARPAIDTVDEVLLLGPALAIALAMRGVFLLHASAVVHENTLCVFLAESGSGKSTLAAHLARLGAHRVADDIVPMTTAPGSVGPVRVSGEFPQWKCLPEHRLARLTDHLPKRLRWFFVQPTAEKASAGVAIEPLDRGATLLKLARHGVATRLFSPHWLRTHQEFCQQAAALPGAVLHYPHHRQSLDEVALCLSKYLATDS